MIYFFTSASKHLAKSFSKSATVGKWQKSLFADAERGFQIKTRVKGKEVGIVGTVTADPESLFELIALHNIVKENGGRARIIVPYLGYARQDRPTQTGEGSIGKAIASVIQNLGAPITVLDIHSDKIRKALGKHKEVSALPLFAKLKKSPEVIVAPDKGAKARAKNLANMCPGSPTVAVIHKVRPRPNVAKAVKLTGKVKGKSCLIVDDMIDTGGTIVEAVKLLRKNGATKISVAATHGIFSKHAQQKLANLPIEKIFITNSLPQKRMKKIELIDISSELMK